jgi:hypothetical protein
LAQFDSARSGEIENSRSGREGCESAEPRYCAANAKSRTYQAKADTKFSAFAAGIEIAARVEFAATISCVETDAPIKKRKF